MTYRHTQTYCGALLALVTVLGNLLSGCIAYRVIVVTATPSATPTLEPTAIPLTPTAVPVHLWLSPDVASDFKVSLDKLTNGGRYAWGDEASAQIKLVTKQQSAAGINVQWVWVPVAPFATIGDDLAWADFQRYWTGFASGIESTSDRPLTLVLTPDSEHYLTTLLGQPSPTLKRNVVAPDRVSSALWESRPSLAFVPFERLTPNMKALTLDGASVFDRNLDLGKYPLVQNFTISGNPQLVDTLMHDAQVIGLTLTTNRDLSKMTILVMTGTTALARATAYHMETEGITLPARDILPFLQDADIVHTSNEVAFAPDCPYPNPAYVNTDEIHFCSNDSYLDLLKAIHLKVVELTGNHMNDWGTDAFSHTLDVYDANP